MSEWISVKDRLPEEGQRVLILLGGEVRFGTKLPELISNPTGIRPDGCHGYDEYATHWMPIPSLPEEAEDE